MIKKGQYGSEGSLKLDALKGLIIVGDTSVERNQNRLTNGFKQWLRDAILN